MVKYLNSLISRFEELKKGISINSEKWNIMPDADRTIDHCIKEVKEIDNLVSEKKRELSEIQAKARMIKEKKKEFISVIEKRALGVHAEETERLKDYNIKG